MHSNKKAQEVLNTSKVNTHQTQTHDYTSNTIKANIA